MGIMDIIKFFQREWGVIWRAPTIFIVAAVIIAGGTWTLATLFYKQEVTGTGAQVTAVEKQVGDVERDRDFWKDVANQKAPILQQITPSASTVTPKPTQAPNPLPYTKPSPRLPIPAKEPPQANLGDTYTNAGTNNGIMGPVTLGRPSFVLTDAMVSKIISILPSGKTVVVRAVGNQRAIEMGQTTAQALTAAGFQVKLESIGMLIPAPNAPVTVSKDDQKSVVTIDPGVG